jgi:hypothetical protein
VAEAEVLREKEVPREKEVLREKKTQEKETQERAVLASREESLQKQRR